ncbi:MAG: DUF4296 domain-containing protein [Chitinophagales bacterium]
MKNLFIGHLVFIITIASLFLSLLSCGKTSNQEADNSIFEPKPIADSILIQLLADFHIAEATVKDLRFRKDTAILKQLRPIGNYYAEILAIHQVSPEKLQAGIDYYADKPVLFDDLYEAVINHLSTVDGGITGAPARTDSAMINQAAKNRSVVDSLQILKSKKGRVKYVPPTTNTPTAVPTKPRNRTRPKTRVKPTPK